MIIPVLELWLQTHKGLIERSTLPCGFSRLPWREAWSPPQSTPLLGDPKPGQLPGAATQCFPEAATAPVFCLSGLLWAGRSHSPCPQVGQLNPHRLFTCQDGRNRESEFLLLTSLFPSLFLTHTHTHTHMHTLTHTSCSYERYSHHSAFHKFEGEDYLC